MPMVYHMDKTKCMYIDGPEDKQVMVTSPLSLRRDSFITPDLRIFSVVLMLNFAFLPQKLMVSHIQGFYSLCLAFVVFCQRFGS